jgi:hypothetical protein
MKCGGDMCKGIFETSLDMFYFDILWIITERMLERTVLNIPNFLQTSGGCY